MARTPAMNWPMTIFDVTASVQKAIDGRGTDPSCIDAR